MDEVGVVSSTISAMSKLPSRNGLATSRMPGSVVPGPFGSFAFVWVGVAVGFGEGVADARGDGVWLFEAEAVGEFGLLEVVEADRGSSGTAR